MINVTKGATCKPVSSQQLAKHLQSRYPDLQGELYIGYPIINTPEGKFAIDALMISREKGLVIFNLIEGRNIDDYACEQNNSANRLETKLRGYSELMNGRDLLAVPEVITFAPVADISKHEVEGFPLCDLNTVDERIDSICWENSDLFEKVLSIIQSISTIRQRREQREINKIDSRGAKLKRLEDSIANLDNQQSKAVIELVDGVQRIRGLAGSGKTIVLALKAAYLHMQNPDWKIAVTFNTRSLKEQFRRLINTFVISQANEEPNWSKISILNAWGGRGSAENSGLYHQYVSAHGLEYVDFRTARERYPDTSEFASVCAKAIEETMDSAQMSLFDIILIDEAQDFAPPFFQMCYLMLTTKKRLVYAYDELQSLTESYLPPPEELFGQNNDGSPRVVFSPAQADQTKRDIILQKCYRNSRPVLVAAHALGFGIYRQSDEKAGTGLVQMFDQPNLWREIGYCEESGALKEGQDVTLTRSTETSPSFLEDHSDINDLIQFIPFDSRQEQAQWLAKQIHCNLNEDELDADDIIVINPDPISTRSAVGRPRRILFDMGIDSHLAGVDLSADTFFHNKKKSIAFTGIFRAKGNEAGMVYIMNAQDCAESYGSLTRIRNQLFTAITRSKSWVRVLGIGQGMQTLMDEYQAVKDANFRLKFTYPTEEVRKTIRIINRDMTAIEKQTTKETEEKLSQLLDDIDAGRVRIEDLPPKVTEGLRHWFGGVESNV